MRLVFCLPVDCKNPPSSAVIQKLEAVDAAGERLVAFGVVRLIGAPDVGNVVPLLHMIRDRILKKSFFAEVILAAFGILIGCKGAGCHRALVIASSRNKACSGIEKTTRSEERRVGKECRSR